MTEQLRLGELGRDRRAVERDERLLRARAARVQQRGDQLLAGAGLAVDEHRDVLARDPGSRVEHAHQRRAAPDDPHTAGLLERALALGDAEPAGLGGALDGVEQLLVVEWLRKVVVGAELERAHREPLGAVRGDHDDGHRRVREPELLEQLHAVHVRHHVSRR